MVDSLCALSKYLGFHKIPQLTQIYFRNSWSKKTVVLLFMQTLDSTLKLKINYFGFMNSSISSGKTISFIPESVN
jgi:cholesterol oxidase